MLVVPKKHIVDFTEIDDATLTHIHSVIRDRLLGLIYDRLGACGLKIVNNYGSEQLVKHYHVHLIPVYEDTNFNYTYSDTDKIDEVFDKLTK